MSIQSETPIFKNSRSGYNSANVNPKKLKYIRFHEDTPISKTTLKIEKKLLLELNNIMRYFSENYVQDINPYSYRNTFINFKNDMENQVFNIIRSYVTKTYTLATEYVADALAVSGFLTKSDIDTIGQMSKEFTDRFFGRIENALEAGIQKYYKNLTDVFIPAFFNQTDETIDNNQEQLDVLVKSIERTESYIFSSLAILIVNSAVNKATILKTQKIILDSTAMGTFQAADENDEIINEIQRDLKKYDRVKTGNVFYIWKTRMDERTCFVCQDLNDRVFSIIDPFIPNIPDDTHFNCRCSVQLIYI